MAIDISTCIDRNRIEYDFDEDGQLVIAGQVIDHGTLAGMLDKYFDGYCPVCNDEIPDGAIVCNNCFCQAQYYRKLHGED